MENSGLIDSINTFDWFVGKVEDINDPMKLGRVRVRCVGYHSPSEQQIPTEHLPWAHLIMPVISTSLKGQGNSPTGMEVGTTVVGFFKDGPEAQEPVIMGTIVGISPATADERESHDTNRLARNEEIDDTIVKTKRDTQKSESMTLPLSQNNTRSQPEVPYKAEYPYNNVYQSRSGHVIEVDDTEDAERIHIYHKSGTMHEIHPDGTMVSRIEKQRYTVVADEDNLHVKGNCNITADGDGVRINATSGRVIINAGDDSYILTGNNATIASEGETMISAGDSSKMKMDGTNITMSASGKISLNASSIHLNG